MSSIVQKLVRHGFSPQQAAILEEMYPEVVRTDNSDSGESYSPFEIRPVELISCSAIAAACTSTAVDEILETFVIPAGELNFNSILQIEPVWSFSSSANNKILKVRVGGATVYSATRTTSVTEAPLIVLANRNSLSSQISPYSGGYVTAGATAVSTYSIDCSKPVVVDILGQRANSGDTLRLEYHRALHFLGD